MVLSEYGSRLLRDVPTLAIDKELNIDQLPQNQAVKDSIHRRRRHLCPRLGNGPSWANYYHYLSSVNTPFIHITKKYKA